VAPLAGAMNAEAERLCLVAFKGWPEKDANGANYALHPTWGELLRVISILYSLLPLFVCSSFFFFFFFFGSICFSFGQIFGIFLFFFF
jgi:hypothetical protein